MVQSLEEDLCTDPLVMCSIVSKSLESSRLGLEFWEGEPAIGDGISFGTIYGIRN